MSHLCPASGPGGESSSNLLLALQRRRLPDPLRPAVGGADLRPLLLQRVHLHHRGAVQRGLAAPSHQMCHLQADHVPRRNLLRVHHAVQQPGPRHPCEGQPPPAPTGSRRAELPSHPRMFCSPLLGEPLHQGGGCGEDAEEDPDTGSRSQVSGLLHGKRSVCSAWLRAAGSGLTGCSLVLNSGRAFWTSSPRPCSTTAWSSPKLTGFTSSRWV